ncbi:MAG: histidine kinase dimerization/phosphoacceptor domain -containing protein [Alphaproteobacteria bacterium]
MSAKTTGTNDEGPTYRALLAQQKMLAEFARYALADGELVDILAMGCRLVAEGLGQGLAKVLELQGHVLVVVASHGYELQPEDMIVKQPGGTSAGHAIATGTPTVSGDVLADHRFDRATIESGASVRSVLNVPIPSFGDSDAAWFGVIEADSPHTDAFSEDQVAFMQLYADIIGAAIERRHDKARLSTLVEEKSRLLIELQHRIKNNLAIITSLVSLQRRRAIQDETRDHLTTIERRIDALRLLHDKLYAHRSSNRLELRDYVMELVENLVEFHGDGLAGVDLDAHVDRYVVSIDKAIPIGLIINEFITNSMKYAFDDAGGQIRVQLGVEDHLATLVLADNGRGSAAEPSGGTGMMLIEGLAGQLGAEAVWSSDGGTSLHLVFGLADDAQAAR